jgi:hypothetical protein
LAAHVADGFKHAAGIGKELRRAGGGVDQGIAACHVSGNYRTRFGFGRPYNDTGQKPATFIGKFRIGLRYQFIIDGAGNEELKRR